MAYVCGVPRQDARRQAAEDLQMQLGMLSRTVKGLAPAEGQQYMSAFIDGLLEVAGSPAQKSSGRRPARKDRVAKKRKNGKGGMRCPGCRARMSKKDAACRRCGQPSQELQVRTAQKAAGIAFLGKSQRPLCPGCRVTSPAGAVCCTSCGKPLLSLVKSAGQIEHDRYMAMARREPDPGRREVYFKLANPDIYGKQGGRAS
jgi:hypothetical protein